MSEQDRTNPVDISAWPEWTAYLADPCSKTVETLDRRARAESADDLLFAAMMREYAASQRWKIAQHLGFLYGLRDCLVESYYFSRKALEQSGDVHARISFAVAAEKYGHLEQALAELELARRQIRSLKDRSTKRACRKAVAVSHVRTSLCLGRIDEAARWNQYVKVVDQQQASLFRDSILAARCGAPSSLMIMVEGRFLNQVNMQDLVNHAELPGLRQYFFAYSGASRPPIPGEAGHPFRTKPATHSG